MRTPTQRQKPRTSQPALFPAPIGGWIANRSKALARDPSLPPGAAMLENWFPTATGIKMRRGTQRHATLGLGSDPVFSLFTYHVGTQEQLFAATMTTIYDVSNITVSTPMEIGVGDDNSLGANDPETVLGETADPGVVMLTGFSSGDWTVAPMTTAGGNFIRGVNGADTPWVYDGASFAVIPALTFGAGDQAEPQDMSFVWSYKQRHFFIRKNTLDAYYLPVNQVGGEMTIFPMGAVFTLGGSLLFGASWSLSGSSSGGLGAQCIFVTTEGEVAVYQGSNPSSATDWSLVGVYRIGRPLGREAFIRAGGDIIIATTIGFVPLSAAINIDAAALASSTTSSPIEEAWTDAVQRRGLGDWQCVTWQDEGMALIAPPVSDERVVFVVNIKTGAWCKFTGWQPRCWAVWRGGLYFGSDGGRVVRASITGADEGNTYTARYMGLFDDLGAPASRKMARLARATLQSTVAINPGVSVAFDWRMTLPAAPQAEPAQADNLWDSARWDRSEWDSENLTEIYDRWKSVGGSGARMAPVLQITSGARIPIDAELIAVEVTFSGADIVT